MPAANVLHPKRRRLVGYRNYRLRNSIISSNGSKARSNVESLHASKSVVFYAFRSVPKPYEARLNNVEWLPTQQFKSPQLNRITPKLVLNGRMSDNAGILRLGNVLFSLMKLGSCLDGIECRGFIDLKTSDIIQPQLLNKQNNALV